MPVERKLPPAVNVPFAESSVCTVLLTPVDKGAHTDPFQQPTFPAVAVTIPADRKLPPTASIPLYAASAYTELSVPPPTATHVEPDHLARLFITFPPLVVN